MRFKRYLFIGPCISQVTGQSIIFNRFYENFSGNKRKLVNASDKRFVAFFKYLFELMNAFFIFNPDVVYFTSSRTKFGFFRDFLLLSLFKLKPGVKVVNHLHGADFLSFRLNNGRLFNLLLDFSYRRINCSVVLSESMKDQYSCYPEMKVFSVNNFAVLDNVDNYAPSLKPFNIVGLKKILFLSNIIESKGIFELIAAVKIANKDLVNYQLDIAGSFLGDKEVEARFYKEITGCDYIFYHGTVSGLKKKSLLVNAGFLALPTFYPTEAQPVCLIEGMFYGCFLITTRHSYIPDFVTEMNGDFVEKKSVGSIVKVLVDLCDDKSIERINRVCVNNVQYANKYFTMTLFLKKMKYILG